MRSSPPHDTHRRSDPKSPLTLRGAKLTTYVLGLSKVLCYVGIKEEVMTRSTGEVRAKLVLSQSAWSCERQLRGPIQGLLLCDQGRLQSLDGWTSAVVDHTQATTKIYVGSSEVLDLARPPF